MCVCACWHSSSSTDVRMFYGDRTGFLALPRDGCLLHVSKVCFALEINRCFMYWSVFLPTNSLPIVCRLMRLLFARVFLLLHDVTPIGMDCLVNLVLCQCHYSKPWCNIACGIRMYLTLCIMSRHTTDIELYGVFFWVIAF